MLDSGQAIKVGHGSLDSSTVSIFLSECGRFLMSPPPGQTQRLGVIADGAASLGAFNRATLQERALITESRVEVNDFARRLPTDPHRCLAPGRRSSLRKT
jgi:hypothetical protein